jgi:hypothetical protein
MTEWFKNNWIAIVIIVGVIFVVSFFLYKMYRFITTKVKGPDLSKDREEMRSDVENLRDAEIQNIAGIKEKAETDKRQIDAGNPTAADIFNKVVKDEEKK